jgi:RNA polymerase sigma factor (sigma-70 family)
MAHGPGLYEQLCDLTGGSDARTDGELLERFLAAGDGDAFAVLLRRHGPLVWGVCRRVLRREHDAEDAFQATFLVLARKAASVRRRASLRSWLYGVAVRIALRARKYAERRHELPAGNPPSGADGPVAAADRAELTAVLDDEIRLLPERYRLPVVLCHLSGWTNDEAARELGCPRGTVAVRLARGRERLRWRLLRRGLGPCAALPALPAVKALPARLVPSTRTNVALYMAGRPTTEMALRLSNGALNSMFYDKCKVGLLALLTAGVLTGVGVGTHNAFARAQETQPPVAAAQEKQDAASIKEQSTARIKELLVKRQQAAASRYESQYEQFEAGHGSLDTILDCCECLVKSDLDVARSKDERLADRQSHFDRLKRILEITTARHRAGRVGTFDLRHAEYCSLNAEIELEREKAR